MNYLRNSILICLMLATVPASALTLMGGALGIGARQMGFAGASTALGADGEALFSNPAALGGIEGIETAGHYGSASNLSPQRSALSLSGGLPGWGDFGVALSDGRYAGSGSFHDNLLILGAAIEISPGIWLGTNQKLISADPGALRGWSMDVGLLASLGRSLRIGLDYADATSALSWGSGLDELQPSTLQGAVAYSPFHGTWLALQGDWLDRNGSGGLGQWRAGVESAIFGRRLQLRAGATQLASAGSELYATAGLGSSWVLGNGSSRLGLDYAMIAPSGGTGLNSGLRHLFRLSYSFGAPVEAAPEASVSKLLKDPRTGKVHMARIELASQDPEDVSEWQLQIKDRRGKLVKSFKGRGALPPGLSWDGKSDNGSLADSDGLSYDLRTENHSGRQSQRHSSLAVAKLSGSALALADAEADNSFGMRASEGKGQKGLRVKPALKGSQDFQLQGADFDLSEVAGNSVDNWELRIVDDQGKVVKKFSGKGRPPKNLKWEGKNDLGEAQDLGLSASYELRVQDSSGKASVTKEDLVQQSDFARIASSRPLPDRQALAPKLRAKRDGAGGWVCVVYFDKSSAALDREAWRVIRDAVELFNSRHLAVLDIRGWADSHEGDSSVLERLAQDRAEAVMRAMVEGYEISPYKVAAKGMGERVSKNPVQNRRVYLHLHN